MKTSWPRVRLGDVLIRRAPDVTVEATSTYRFAGVYSFGRGVFESQERRGVAFAYKKLTRLRQGEFVYPKLMAWEGAFGIVPPACEGCYVSPEFPVFEIDTGRLVPAFLGFYFRSPAVWASVSGRSTGTNIRRRRLHPAELARHEMLLSSLPDQRRVVARIEELRLRVRDANALHEAAEMDADRLLLSMAHRVDLDDDARKAAQWRRVALRECIRLVDDSRRVVPAEMYPNFGIYSFGNGLFVKAPIEGSRTRATTLRRVTTGQFIYSRLFAFEGAYGMVGREYDGYFVSNEYPTFQCDPGVVRAEFLAAYFKAPFVWRAVGAGSRGLGDRRQRVQPQQVLAHELWIPPMKWQDCIAAVVAELAAAEQLRTAAAIELGSFLPVVFDQTFRRER